MKLLTELKCLVVMGAFALTTVTAHAQVKSKLDFETSLQDRIEKSVRFMDPQAVVRVSIEFKNLTASLPGTSLNIKDVETDDSRGLSADSIARISVMIRTTKQEIPQWLNDEIKTIAQFKNVPLKIELAELPAEMLASADNKHGAGRGPASVDSTLTEKLFNPERLPLTLLQILIVVALVGHTLLSHFRNRGLTKMLSTVANSLNENFRGASMPSAPRASAETSAAPRQAAHAAVGGATSKGELSDLPMASVVNLFADCYWTEQDAYAAWVWESLSSAQRIDLTKAWPTAGEYANYISGLASENLGYHRHPAYLQAWDLSQVSSKDLQKLVKKEAALWQALTPLRQASLQLSLKEQLLCLQATAASQMPHLPASAERRKFSSTAQELRIGAEEELAIFNNPDLVPIALRSKVNSLLWLALATLEKRKEVLAQLKANEIAMAWDAPPEILAKLEEAIPETKLRLVNSYLKQIAPSRKSEAFKYLVREAFTQEEPRNEVA